MAAVNEVIKDKVEQLFPRLVEMRRQLHMYPELSNKEFKTTRQIKKWLEESGIKTIPLTMPTGTAAEIKGRDAGGPTVAIRADIDALPIQEESDLPFRSKVDGVSHMCGHDVHTAIALGAAVILQEMADELPVNVRILFQPAEEAEGGAEGMIKEGLLKGVNSIIGLHNSPELPTGTVGVKEGFLMASVDDFWITIKGKGGHAALPEKTIDPIVIGSAIVGQLQTIASRTISAKESAVVTIGSFQAGATNNVIPDTAMLKGTVRTSNEQVRRKIAETFKRVVTNTASALGGDVEIDYQFLLPAVFNDAGVTAIVREVSETIVGKEKTVVAEPTMGGEDFSFYQQEVPGCYVWLGSGNEAKGIKEMWHHPKFMVDEEAMKIGVQLMVQSAIRLLEKSTTHD
ncbi:M20 metallopeptidase family protein [Bacillus sp. FJAT-27245]|uniref:M20 metallopeptidase family protein n=1 Tax=Bacillus sp. FJAT-27245 TaxID=1684144 RepID=UPI0006A7B240|nr:amidohydrolase [Bacillus sp. FJAT-27245]